MNNLHEKCLGNGFTDDQKKFMKHNVCKKVVDGHCTVYANPTVKWEHPICGDRCNMATNYRPDLAVVSGKVRQGQQKGKKGKKNR